MTGDGWVVGKLPGPGYDARSKIILDLYLSECAQAEERWRAASGPGYPHQHCYTRQALVTSAVND